MRPRLLALAGGAVLALGGCAHFEDRPIAPLQTAAAFDARTLDDPGLVSFLASNHLAGSGAWDVDRLTFAAFYFQPALAETRLHVESARAAIKTAKQIPNPNLTVTPSYDRQPADAPTPWSLQPITLDQQIETMGKRRYRTEAAQHTAEAELWNLNAAIWQVRVKVRASLLALYLARERQHALSAQADAQAEVARLMAGQLKVGQVSGYDVSQSRIAAATQHLAARDGASQEAQALTDLATTIGVPRQALAQAPFSFAGLDRVPELSDPGALRAEALQSRADVQAALAQYAAAQSALQLEIANQYPDIHLGPGYQWNANQLKDSMYQLSVSFNLPIWNQNQGPIAEATAKRREAAAHFLTVQAAAISEIDGALASYTVALDEGRMAEKLASDLQDKRKTMEALQRVGEADPLTTHTSEVEYYNGALTRLDALGKAQTAYGALEDALENPAALSESARTAAANVPARNP